MHPATFTTTVTVIEPFCGTCTFRKSVHRHDALFRTSVACVSMLGGGDPSSVGLPEVSSVFFLLKGFPYSFVGYRTGGVAHGTDCKTP